MTSKIDDLTAKIEADPLNARLYHERGWEHNQGRRWKLAIADFDRAIALDESEPDFWLSRGEIKEHLGHVGAAQSDLDHAIKLKPDYAGAYNVRGWYYKSNHRPEDSVTDYDRAIELNPVDPFFRCNRAVVLADLGRLGEALEDFDEAIRLDPEEASFYYKRACARLYDNPDVNPEDAMPDLDEAIRLDPTAIWYRSERGYIHYCLGRWGDASEDFASQDIPYKYQMCKYLGAEVAIWYYLARLFQGEEAAGQEFVKGYLEWYSTEMAAEADARTGDGSWTWPLPLARHLAGEVDERQILEMLSSELREPGLVLHERDNIEKRILELHFVIGELRLARGGRDEALVHMRQVRELPARNPMWWVATQRVAHVSTGEP